MSCRAALKAAMDAAKQQQQAARPHWQKKRKAEAAAPGGAQPAVPANRPTSTGSDTGPTKAGWAGGWEPRDKCSCFLPAPLCQE